jgi:hypothetical protein
LITLNEFVSKYLPKPILLDHAKFRDYLINNDFHVLPEYNGRYYFFYEDYFDERVNVQRSELEEFALLNYHWFTTDTAIVFSPLSPLDIQDKKELYWKYYSLAREFGLIYHKRSLPDEVISIPKALHDHNIFPSYTLFEFRQVVLQKITEHRQHIYVVEESLF